MQQNQIMTAVDKLKQGQVIAYPTEAIWGLGCDPYQQNAFEKILQLKQRPIEKGVILLASDIEQIDFLLQDLTPTQYKIILDSWKNTTLNQQQASTWLFPTHDKIPHWITGQYQKVAVRVSHHTLCQQLCRNFGGFIVSTSANLNGLAPALNESQVREYFADRVYIVQGHLGQSHRPSRIIDAITGQILRA